MTVIIRYTRKRSAEDDSPEQPLAVLDKKHVESIAKTLECHKPFSEGGEFRGKPDRTAVLPSEDIRLTYVMNNPSVAL